MTSNSTSDQEISIDEDYISSSSGTQEYAAGLKYLPHWAAVNIEFQDLVCSVPDIGGANKVILRGVSGSFKSNQLTAILGPSGAGKSTLLNILAGYKCSNVTGTINVNRKLRDMRNFRKMSRYIMQQDWYPKMLTVKEALMVAADLKLGNTLTKEEKLEVIHEILDLLRLTKAINTMGHKLSGGERKRLSIAMELVNNPPVLFLDEPTTGLDDLSSSQCISLLRRIAHGGRTVICSIHTPSAKIFEMFDHVYIVANGQCIYQGKGSYIVPYLDQFDLNCPRHYNPADFMIDVACGEYGHEFLDKMVTNIDNGRLFRWKPPSSSSECSLSSNERNITEMEEEINPKHLKSKTSSWDQFVILYKRMTKQMFRDVNYLLLKFYMHIFLGFVIGGLFFQMGNDATKTLFNFGFCFTIIVFFMYIPMMPVLLQLPQELQTLKREHFNRWYRLTPYYFAMIVSKLPVQLLLAVMYLTMLYFMTDQPFEWDRIFMFYGISLMISLTSESLGTLIASRLSIVNGMFVGPVLTVPLMLLAVYGIGNGKDEIPKFIRVFMSLSYLRYGLEGIVDAIYGHNRQDTVCPEDELYCPYSKPQFLLKYMGFEDVDYRLSLAALIFFYVFFNIAAFLMIRQRLSSRTQNNKAVQYIGRLVKTHFNFSPYKY